MKRVYHAFAKRAAPRISLASIGDFLNPRNRGSERVFNIYSRAWKKAGRNQVARTKFGAKMSCDLEGDVFVDVGANVGYYSLMASKIVGKIGAVVAIEPSPHIFARLQANLTANRLTNVRAVNVAVAAEAGSVTIYSGPAKNSGATSILKTWRNGEPEAVVTALPLDQILTETERKKIALIKIDVEGAEKPILSQLLSSIECYPRGTAIIVECSPGDGEIGLSAVFSGFIAKGFSAYGINNGYDAAWYLNWRQPTNPQWLEACPRRQVDILFTRKSSDA